VTRPRSHASPSALFGVKVLDLATLFPAPVCAAMLGDLGADVVKVEPADGDPLRVTGVMKGDRSYVWALAGRNKRSIRIDLGTSAGISLVQGLSSVADVVVVNQPPKVLQRWGCTYEDVAARNPGVIMVAISGYGADGPKAERPGNGTLAEAFAGLSYMIGEPDGPPMLPSIPLGDCLGAWSGVIGALSALYWRDARGGRGQYVDVSMFEAVMTLLGPAMVAWQPGHPAPRRTGSRVPGGVPRNAYETADGRWIALSGTTNAQVGRVLQVIGRNDEAHVARFGRSADRLAHAEELDGLVADWIRVRDAADVLAAFVEARIPVAEINDLNGVVTDPHVIARRSVTTLEDPELGSVSMPAPIPHLSVTPPVIASVGPQLGVDTDDICREWLELPDDEIHGLRSVGAI
jgi:crotonobetainyl-CoA:carnitine CoA-transferase CaiB-like acyl-CoA transferase